MQSKPHMQAEHARREHRLRDVFDRAMDMRADDRTVFVRQALADDAEGMSRILRWITDDEADDEASDAALAAVFDLAAIDSACAGAADSPQLPGRRLLADGDEFKAWTIVRLLGKSRASEVYEGVGGDGGRVAIKFVLAARWSDDAMRRARLAAYILSMVDHPGVVGHLDDGVVTDGPAAGLPYLVTALAEGQHADAWAQQATATTPQIVEMIARAADGVYQANLRGAVHRDLKPSNIIVRGPAHDPSVVVIDFGVASLVYAESRPRDSLISLQSTIVGTIDYMAPEQFLPSTHPPDMRCDVYALAAVGYTLIAGRPPHIAAGLGIVEAARLKEQPPPRLATLADMADVPATSSKLLSKLFEVALSTQPGDRFETCRELAENLRRALRGLPGTKERPGPLVQARVFARRQPVLAAAIVVAVLAVLSGIAGVAWQARVAMAERDLARQRLEDTQRFARWIMEDMDESLAGMPGSAPLRRHLVEEAAAYLDRLAGSVRRGDGAAARDLRLNIVEARIRLGDVLGNTTFVNLGDAAGSESQYRSALATLSDIKGGGDEARALYLTARALSGLAMCLKVDHPEYFAIHDRAMMAYDEAAAKEPQNIDRLADRAGARASWAWSRIYPDRRWTLAMPGLERAVTEARAALALDPARKRTQRVLARCLMSRGECHDRLGEPSLAEADLKESLAAWERLDGVGEPDTALMLRECEVVNILGSLAMIRGRAGDPDSADALSQSAVSRARHLFEKDQVSQTASRTLEVALNRRALALIWSTKAHLASGQPLTARESASLVDARSCTVEFGFLHDRRAARNQVGQGEQGYREMGHAILDTIDALLRQAVEGPSAAP